MRNIPQVERFHVQNYRNQSQSSQRFKTREQSQRKITSDQTFIPAIQPIQKSIRISQQNYIYYCEQDNQIKLRDLLPKVFFDKMYKFQRRGVKFGMKNNGRVLIGDEMVIMGVGKTIQALALAYVYKQNWPLLIVCPSLLMYNWKDEALSWIKELNETDIQVVTKQKEIINRKRKIIITSYDLATHHVDNLKDFQIAIADEAHNLKSGTSKRSLALVPFLKQMRHVILLTGTPALAKPKEIFNLLQIVRPDVFFSFIAFGDRYCDPRPSRFKKGYDYDGCTNATELHNIITQSIMIRRLKRDVLDQLPNKIRQNIKINVDKTIVKELVAMMKENMDKIDLMLNGGSSNMQPGIQTDVQFDEQGFPLQQGESSIALIQKCYLLTGQAKVDGVCEYLEEVIDDSSDQKFIVFAHHILVLDKLQEFFTKQKWNFIRIDGQVSNINRHKFVQQFQCDTNCQIALLSLTAASVGLTLTAASTVIFTELHWTPGVMKQAEDRAHRIGQKSCVSCIYLIGQKTLDDKILEILWRKDSTVGFILDGGSKKQYDYFEETKWSQKRKNQDKKEDQNQSEYKEQQNNEEANSIQKMIEEQPIQSIIRKGKQGKQGTLDHFILKRSTNTLDLNSNQQDTEAKPQQVNLEELLQFLNEIQADEKVIEDSPAQQVILHPPPTLKQLPPQIQQIEWAKQIQRKQTKTIQVNVYDQRDSRSASPESKSKE